MSGVNNLAKFWEDCAKCDRSSQVKRLVGDGMNVCADDLTQIARTAWHPVSSYEDAKDAPQETVMVRRLNGEIEQAWGPSLLTDWDVVTHWARINDVVLLPEDT